MLFFTSLSNWTLQELEDRVFNCCSTCSKPFSIFHFLFLYLNIEHLFIEHLLWSFVWLRERFYSCFGYSNAKVLMWWVNKNKGAGSWPWFWGHPQGHDLSLWEVGTEAEGKRHLHLAPLEHVNGTSLQS